MSSLSGWALNAALKTSGRAAHSSLLRSAANPARAQAATLRRLLDLLAPSELGREHGYDRFMNADAFRAAVPIRDYETLRPWIDRQISGAPAITPEPVLMYARTSGTTGTPKYAPVTASSLRGLRRAQQVMAYAQQQLCPLFAGRILVLAGAMREETLAGGVPAGSTTGLIYGTMPAAVRNRYVVPPEVFAIEDPEVKYAAITRLAFQHEDLTAVSTANPSTFLRLRDWSRANWSTALEGLAAGAFPEGRDLPPPQAEAMLRALRPRPDRARALDRLAQAGEPTPAELWPRLSGVVTWTGGGCALAADAVRAAVGPNCRLIEAGYVSSEFRGTVIVDAASDFGLPLLDDVFLEFVPVEAWDSGSRDTFLLHELEEGREYQVLATTPSGLVRYHINDVLLAGPRIAGTPSLRFVRKGRGVTSITGEKLTEAQLGQALQEIARAFGVAVVFHIAIAEEAAARYVVYVESEQTLDAPRLAEALDQSLSRLNIEYAAKRKSGRLRPPILHRLANGAGAAYRAWCVSRGQRDAQFKVLTLQTRRECAFDFDAWAVP